VFRGAQAPPDLPPVTVIPSEMDAVDRAPQEERQTRQVTGTLRRAEPTASAEAAPAAANSISKEEYAQLVKQGYTPELIARLEQELKPAVSHAPTTGTLKPAPESPMQQPRVDIGAEKVGRAEGLSKEQVRQQTAPILGEEQGAASPILPEKALQRIIDTLKELPKGGPEREAYVQAATSGKAQWQIENIRRTLEHLGLIGAGAVALDPVRVELMQRMRQRSSASGQ
jgi:hypothetical protein